MHTKNNHYEICSQKFWSWTKNNTSTHSKIPTSGCEQITTPAFIQNFCLKNSGCEQIATPAFIPNIYLKNSGTIFKSVGAHNRPLPRLKQKFLLRKSFEGFCKISRLQKRGCTWPKRQHFRWKYKQQIAVWLCTGASKGTCFRRRYALRGHRDVNHSVGWSAWGGRSNKKWTRI